MASVIRDVGVEERAMRRWSERAAFREGWSTARLPIQAASPTLQALHEATKTTLWRQAMREELHPLIWRGELCRDILKAGA